MPVTTRAWLDAFFESYYQHRPVSATFIGVHEHDGRLPDYSAAGIDAQLRDVAALLEQVDSGEVAEPETTWEAVDRLLARNFLLTQVWELRDTEVVLGNPCLYTGEAIFSIIALFLRDYAPLEERVAAATTRMRGIPELLAQGRARVPTCPATWVARALSECDGAVKLLTEGLAVLRARHGVTQPEFHDAAGSAADAFRAFRRYLTDEVTPHAHERYGIGSAAFDMLLRRAHCLEMDGAAVSVYARRRLAEAQQALAEGAAQLAPGRDPRDVLAGLHDLHPPLEEYYAAYQTEFDRARDFAVERELLTWSDYPITFEPIPDWARAAAPHLYFLFYRAPAPFDPHVIQRYLVTPIEPDMPEEEQQRRLRATNWSQIRLNHIIHHGGIGHHVQNWWAYQSASRIGQMAAVDCALRIAMLCGGTMAEGWACYATDLMAEQGYVTPLEQLSECQGLARMAARAIVDVELHAGALSFDAAVALYRDEAWMPEAAARAEVVKNSLFPGAAMMYLIGTDAIHTLREEMRTRWGAAFSLRRFHDTLLSYGSIPVTLTAKLMRGVPLDSTTQLDDAPA
jgi:uncharacterized protein (DUF885 family)